MYAKNITASKINFLAGEHFFAKPEYIDANNYNVQTDDEGKKYVPAGTVYPSNDAKAVGLTVDDVYVGENATLVGVMREAWVLEDRLPVAPTSEAKAAMAGIKYYAPVDGSSSANETGSNTDSTAGKK